MRESIGSAMLFYIIITFVVIIIITLVGSLSYSKAFKLKTKIVDIIERYHGYDADNEEQQDEIDSLLSKVGYRVGKSSCEANNLSNSNYNYCVYGYNTPKGPYYKVVVFIEFELPIINTVLRFPLSGETEIIYLVEG